MRKAECLDFRLGKQILDFFDAVGSQGIDLLAKILDCFLGCQDEKPLDAGMLVELEPLVAFRNEDLLASGDLPPFQGFDFPRTVQENGIDERGLVDLRLEAEIISRLHRAAGLNLELLVLGLPAPETGLCPAMHQYLNGVGRRGFSRTPQHDGPGNNNDRGGCKSRDRFECKSSGKEIGNSPDDLGQNGGPWRLGLVDRLLKTGKHLHLLVFELFGFLLRQPDFHDQVQALPASLEVRFDLGGLLRVQLSEGVGGDLIAHRTLAVGSVFVFHECLPQAVYLLVGHHRSCSIPAALLIEDIMVHQIILFHHPVKACLELVKGTCSASGELFLDGVDLLFHFALGPVLTGEQFF